MVTRRKNAREHSRLRSQLFERKEVPKDKKYAVLSKQTRRRGQRDMCVKCRSCKKQKSLKMIRREIGIVTGFYQQVPAYRLANDLGVDYQTVTRVFQNLRLSLYYIAELEGAKLSREVEMDEAQDNYCRWKTKR